MDKLDQFKTQELARDAYPENVRNENVNTMFFFPWLLLMFVSINSKIITHMIWHYW